MVDTNEEIYFKKWFLDAKSERKRIEFIDNEINQMLEEFPYLKEYLNKPAIPIGVIYLLSKLKPIDEMMLFDLVWINVEILFKESLMNDRIIKKLQPINKIFLDFVKTDKYIDVLIGKEITGDEILKYGNKTIPISKQAIKLHVSRLKAVPIIPNEIQVIQDDWENFVEKRNKYRIMKNAVFSNSVLNNEDCDKNHYLRIFPNSKSWQLFDHWRNDVKARTQLAEFSFIYWQMLKDGLIDENVKPTEFRNWLYKNYNVELDDLKQLSNCNGGNKYSRYQTAKLLFQC